jgi:hypothetical protein
VLGVQAAVSVGMRVLGFTDRNIVNLGMMHNSCSMMYALVFSDMRDLPGLLVQASRVQ